MNMNNDAMMERKLNLFGHIYRMNNSRRLKQVVFGLVDGSGIRGRPNKEWPDDIKEWCQMDVHRRHSGSIKN